MHSIRRHLDCAEQVTREQDDERPMRIVRDYFGVDRTTVTYEHEISGVGGTADDFFVVAEAMNSSGAPAVRTIVHFTHEEMAHLLADYRQNHPIEGTARQFRLPAPAHCRLACRAWDAFMQIFRIETR
jgi:hypothetical protein